MKREPACKSLVSLNHGGGGFVTALLESLPHLAQAYCRADLSNQKPTARAILAVLKALAKMGVGDHGEKLVVMYLGSREQGGRGTELLEYTYGLGKGD